MRVGRSGLVVKKMGMTTLFLDSGVACPVTLFFFRGMFRYFKQKGCR